jgi:predicted MFS family arabinose efflux permease
VILGVIYGGLAFTVYGLSVAHVNDLIDSSRVLEVTGGLLLLHGIGATVGPTVAGSVMYWLGPESLMLYFATVLALLAAGIWALARGKAVVLATDHAKAAYVVMGSGSAAALQMDPRRASDKAPAPPASP